MMFCPGDKCEHYGKATKYARQCYYEPMCWRGVFDIILAVFRIRSGTGECPSKENRSNAKKS